MTWHDGGRGPESRPVGGPLITSREHAVIRDFLQSRVPHLAEAYDTIHAIFNGAALPSGPYLAAHLIRDFINVLPAATLRGTTWDSQLHRAPNWRGLWFRFSELVASNELDASPVENLPPKAKAHLVVALASVATEKKKPRATELLIRSQLLPGELTQHVQGAITALEDHRRYFVDHAHLRDGADAHEKYPTLDELRIRFRSLEVILAGFLGGSLDALAVLNAWLIRQDPAEIDAILERATTPVLAMEFWNGLTNANLIAPLHDRGRFTTSVRVELTEEGGSALLQSPSLRALARLTPSNPAEALRVWLSLKLEFSHDLHHLIAAANACTADVAHTLGQMIAQHIAGGLRPLIEREIFQLMGHLTAQGGVNIALSLLDVMLVLAVDQKRSYKEIQLRNCDTHDLRADMSQQAIKAMVLARPDAVCEIVLNKIRANEALGGHWHALTSIDQDAGNNDREPEVALVEILRDAVRWAVDAGIMTGDRVLERLKPDERLIDKRLHIYVVGNYGTQDQADALMGNAELFDDAGCKNEVANLFKRRYSQASGAVRLAIVARIERGPDDDAKYADHWRFCKLSWIRASLTGEAAQQYAALFQRFGEEGLELADRNHRVMISGFGPISPYTAAELAALPIADAVQRTMEWAAPPMRGFQSPTLEGLADAFGQAVVINALPWSGDALALAGMKPYFISRSLNGWLTYLREKSDLNWAGLMDLIDHILAQSSTSTVSQAQGDSLTMQRFDHDWKWTRQCIADLIAKALEQGADISLRPRFIAALRLMVDDDPTSAISDDRDFFATDHAADALNSARGKVATALCALAVWTAKADPAWQPEAGHFAGDLASLTDVLVLIERQLSDESAENAATWAAYALAANQLRWLAPDWYQHQVAEKIVLVVAAGEKLAPCAFWMTFLKYQSAHHVWFLAHEASYRAMVTWIQGVGQEQQASTECIPDFLNQLMVYYWQGDLDLSEGGLIASTFVAVTPSIRMQTIGFLGSALERGDAPPPEVCERFRLFWGWYWTRFGAQDIATRKHDPHRRSLFGDWFSSNYLGGDWSIRSLVDYLFCDAESDHDDDVLEQLEQACSTQAVLALEATRHLVLGDREGWRMHLWQPHITRMLAGTRAVNSPPVQRARSALREALVRRGHPQFGTDDPPQL